MTSAVAFRGGVFPDSKLDASVIGNLIRLMLGANSGIDNCGAEYVHCLGSKELRDVDLAV